MILRHTLPPALRRVASSPPSPLTYRPSPRSRPWFCCCRARMLSTLPRLPIFEAVAGHDPAATAVVHSVSGRSFTYGQLLADVSRARDRRREARGGADLDGERIAFLVENSYDYVVTLLAAIAARSIAVPLSPAFPAPELQYILNHSEASLLVSSFKFTPRADEVLATELTSKPAHLELAKHVGGQEKEAVALEDTDPAGAGLMLYTSGTTNRPKGVLLPQSALTAQCRSLVEAWKYTPSDHLLHVLPLHHIHGTVNALLAPLFAGSSIEFMFPFNADTVWKRLATPFLATNGTTTNGITATQPKVTFFTVVPTVYSRLLASHKSLPAELQEAARQAISPANLRVNISGSAALPTPIKAAWQTLSRGNVLLERYGMTEVGMALSCGLDFADRVDASVGWPLPSVQARLMDVDTGEVIPPGQDVDGAGRERSGEIQLRGPTIFKEYWRNPDATAKEFIADLDGHGPWFKTGDIAIRRPVPSAGHSAVQPWARGPLYFIQGRRTADIIKTGGEKVSALEVERELLSLPEVAEAAVVAVPSGNWGQKVGAVIILDTDVVHKWSPLDMRRALKSRLANYKIPQVMKVVDHIPRNAMGKINKKLLVRAIFSDAFSGDER
ncbi:Acyl-CoA synthetase family member 3, mitochondrial [Tolypocladium ophioglossoides CBS 100239]|uniref:Acyl-CoA synthetase family member 3, mitochondrial n=1 Tax=Tolypocladium ophioglossoides (strain CBS 100239) TaxID=1163406 RepID=A0A0L0NA92_TOLOC|nr:Acyl-CoA synthetase family member 3, mitochondrial [Tolypocladium ophioglossoides CBS 100239]